MSDKHKNKFAFCVCMLTGLAMFYDFVHQCVNCYVCAADYQHISLNYFIPLCLSALSAILCASYFFTAGFSFVTNRYSFMHFKYFHLMPACRHLFAMFSALSVYKKGIYGMENAVYSAVLIFGLLFFIYFAAYADGSVKIAKLLCFFGFSYAVLCFALAVPRIAFYVYGAEISKTDFLAVTYLFTGIFAAFLSVNITEKDKKEG